MPLDLHGETATTEDQCRDTEYEHNHHIHHLELLIVLLISHPTTTIVPVPITMVAIEEHRK